jgi:hypothetical protein
MRRKYEPERFALRKERVTTAQSVADKESKGTTHIDNSFVYTMLRQAVNPSQEDQDLESSSESITPFISELTRKDIG